MSQACPNSRRRRRMKVGHRFIGGVSAVQKAQCVKRTAEQIRMDSRSFPSSALRALALHRIVTQQ